MGSLPEPAFEDFLAQMTVRGSNNVPGAVLAAVDKHGEVFYSKAAGYGGVAPDAEPIDPEGTFWIASCTKLLTSICALQCVERGLVTLDEPISRILPELKTPQIVTADSNHPDGFTLKAATKSVTLRQLLTHSSGVGYAWMDPTLGAWREKTGPEPEKLKGRVVATFTAPLLFEPGGSWAYGGGIDWAGVVVERVNGGNPLGAYMEEEIFRPLGMTSTTFNLSQRPDVRKKLVPAAKREEDGSLAPAEGPISIENPEEHSGGGGLWSSVPDYIAVLADLLKDSPRLLKKETVEGMLMAPQLSGPALDSLQQQTLAITANAAAVVGGVNYGLGGLVVTEDSDELPKGTLTWGGLPNLKWFVNRRYGVAALYATQVLPYGDAKNVELSSAFFREVLRLAKEKA